MGFSSRKLAYVLDSLVRVSRRVSWSHFDKISIKETLNYNDTISNEDSKVDQGAFFECLLYTVIHFVF